MSTNEKPIGSDSEGAARSPIVKGLEQAPIDRNHICGFFCRFLDRARGGIAAKFAGSGPLVAVNFFLPLVPLLRVDR
jgi:hypothetical protein